MKKKHMKINKMDKAELIHCKSRASVSDKMQCHIANPQVCDPVV